MIALVAYLLVLRQAPPPHLTAAFQLVTAIKPDQTSYRHDDSVVVWPSAGINAECDTDCSGFWNALISHTYPQITSERIEGWIGKKRPRAEDYFAIMRDGIGFKIRKTVREIRPGDFIAIRYESGADNTGHTMVVFEAPRSMTPQAPLVDGTQQYSLPVIDVTSTPHGAGDSRGKSTGLGMGTVRIYANQDGTLDGHAWSLSNKAKFRPMSVRPMVVGELDLSGIPKIEVPFSRGLNIKKPRDISGP